MLKLRKVPQTDATEYVHEVTIPVKDPDTQELAGDVTLKLRADNDPEYQARRQLLYRHLYALRERAGIGSDVLVASVENERAIEKAEDAIVRLVAERLIVDWSGVVDDDGKALPYSTAAAYELLQGYPTLAADVTMHATTVAAMVHDETAGVVEK